MSKDLKEPFLEAEPANTDSRSPQGYEGGLPEGSTPDGNYQLQKDDREAVFFNIKMKAHAEYSSYGTIRERGELQPTTLEEYTAEKVAQQEAVVQRENSLKTDSTLRKQQTVFDVFGRNRAGTVKRNQTDTNLLAITANESEAAPATQGFGRMKKDAKAQMAETLKFILQHKKQPGSQLQGHASSIVKKLKLMRVAMERTKLKIQEAYEEEFEKEESTPKDDILKSVVLKLQAHLKKKMEQSKKTIENDSKFIRIYCPKSSLLMKRERTVRGDESYCYGCFHKGINLHASYYECESNHKCGMSRFNLRGMCRVCAECLHGGNGLEYKTKVPFYPHELYRQPISYEYQWACYQRSPEFQEWLASRGSTLPNRCSSFKNGCVQPRRYQGFECRQRDFDMCFDCLVKYTNLEKLEKRYHQNRSKFQVWFSDLPEEEAEAVAEAHINKSDDSHSFNESMEENECYVLEDAVVKEAHPPLDQKDNYFDKLSKTRSQQTQIDIIDTPKQIEECKFMAANEPDDCFRKFLGDFIKKQPSEDVFRKLLKIRGYQYKKADLEDGSLWFPPGKKHKSHQEMFGVVRRHFEILESETSDDFYIIVKTIEQFYNAYGAFSNVIKVIKIFDPQNNFELIDEILVEKINAWNYYNEATQMYNFVYTLNRGLKLYFFRRVNSEKHPKKKCLQLYRYDLEAKIKQATNTEDNQDKILNFFSMAAKNKGANDPTSRYFKKVKPYCFEENRPIGNLFTTQDHIAFGQFLNEDKFKEKINESQMEADRRFLNGRFIVLQKEFKWPKKDDNIKEWQKLNTAGEWPADNEFTIYQLRSDAKEPTRKITTNSVHNCKRLIQQFFVKRETISSSQGGQDQNVEGAGGGEGASSQFMKIDFVLMDKKVYSSSVIQEKNDVLMSAQIDDHGQTKMPFKVQKIETFNFQPTNTQEIQAMTVKIDAIPQEFTQYFMVDWYSDIVLIHPVEFDNETIMKQVIDEIGKKLGNRFQEGGKRLLINDTVRTKAAERAKYTQTTPLNLDVYELFFKASRNFTEKQNNFSMRSDLNTIGCRINIVKKLYRTYIFLYYERRDVPKHIEVIRLENRYREISDYEHIRHVLSGQQQLVTKNILNLTTPQKLKQISYMNSVYQGVVSTPTKIDSSLQQEQKAVLDKTMETMERFKVFIKQKRWPEKNINSQMVSMPQQLRQNYIFIEKVASPTNKQISYLTPGMYMRVRMVDYIFDKELKLISYYISRNYYIFFMILGEREFFVRKPIDEVLALDCQFGSIGSILTDDTTIQLIVTSMQYKKVDYAVKSIKYLDLKHDMRQGGEKDFYVETEPILDNRNRVEMVVFTVLLPGKKKKVKDIHLCVFDVNSGKLTVNQSISLMKEDMEDLTVDHVWMTRHSRLQTIVSGEEFSNDGKLYHPFQIQKQVFAVTHFLPNQSQRFITKQFSIEHHQTNKTTLNILDTETVTFFKQTAQTEIFCRHIKLIEKDSLFKVLPIINFQGDYVGTQLMKFTGEKDARILALFDSNDENNVLKYRSDLITYGHQRFYDTKASYNQGLKNYCQVFEVKLDEAFIDQKGIDLCEQQIILREMMQRMANMIEFQYFNEFFTPFKSYSNRNFFEAQELFFGKSMCDIYLNDEQSLRAILDKHQEDEPSEDTILRRMMTDQKGAFNTLKKNGMIQDFSILSFDFSFISQLERSLMLNAQLSANVLLEYVFSLNKPQYSKILMTVIPKFIEKDQVSMILPFFARTNEEQQIIEMNEDRGIDSNCNMEKFFRYPKLPRKSDMEKEDFHLTEVTDYAQQINQIINVIRQRDEEKGKEGVDCDRSISVEHSFIDFQFLSLGQKIRQVGDRFVCDNRYISDMMIQESVEFYEQEAIQKVIDYQFNFITEQFFTSLLKIYCLFFLVPLMVIIFYNDGYVEKVCFIVCYITQLFFFGIEIIQMKDKGLAYLKGWNLFDLSQFLVFMVLMFHAFYYPKNTEDDVTQLLLKLLIVMQAFLKVLFFMKIFAEYGFLVQMIFLSIVDVGPFMTFFSLWVLYFTIEFKILKWEMDEEEYKGLTEFVQRLILTFRNSIGDLSLPGYDKWLEEPTWESKLVVSLLWLMWFVNIFLMLIMLLNFLIAVISQTYERVASSQVSYTYKDRAEMNQECMQILSHFYKSPQMKMIVFSQDRSLWTGGEDQWGGVVDAIKKSLFSSIKDVHKRLRTNQKHVVSQLDLVRTQQLTQTNSLQDMRMELSRLEQSVRGTQAERQETLIKENKLLKKQVKTLKEDMASHHSENKEFQAKILEALDNLSKAAPPPRSVSEPNQILSGEAPVPVSGGLGESEITGGTEEVEYEEVVSKSLVETVKDQEDFE